MKKSKWINIIVWVGLAVLVCVVIVTSIILHSKRRKLDDLKDKNDVVAPAVINNAQENKIFFKNFAIFIDNHIFF